MARSEDIALAKKLCDPFLSSRVVGQHIDTKSDEGLILYQAGQKLSMNLAMAENAKLDQSDPQYWINIGNKWAPQPTSTGLWCDGSAGIIISLLAMNPSFKSKMEVVKQDDPKVHGHWFVVANRPSGAPLDWGSTFGDESFVIDIWGALRTNKSTTVVDPGDAIFDCGGSGDPADNVLVSVCTIAPK